MCLDLETKLGMVIHHNKPECHVKTNWVAIFKVKVTVGIVESEHDCFYYICWTADHIETKLSLLVHHHKWKCLTKRLLCYVQSQCHNEGSELCWMFVQTIFSESSSWVIQKNSFAVIVKVTMWASIIKIWSCCTLRTALQFATELSLMVQ